MSTTLNPSLKTQQEVPFPTAKPKYDPNRMMNAVEWNGTKSVKVVQRGKPMVTDAGDAIIRVTSTTICGSDLHMYTNEKPIGMAMKTGDILGHEPMGIVEEVGPNVKNFKVGDRVVVSFCISCGACEYCKKQLFTLCDNTNPSKEMEKMYGHRISGAFGYSHLTGGYDGGQADYLRVPLADNNMLKITGNKPDEKYLFLSDIVCTGWWANEMGEVKQGSTVVVWGCGPVGLMAQMWAKFRGASRVIAVDGVDYRLKVAREKLGSEIIDFREEDVVAAIQKMLPGGPDVCIDAVGFRFPKSLLHKIERAVKLETDSPQILNEAILACKKGGNISIVGDYFAYANQFPIGPMMEKGLTVRGGQTPVQRYWKELLGYIESGKVDPSFVISHTIDLTNAADAYKIFEAHEDNALKIILKPSSASSATPTKF